MFGVMKIDESETKLWAPGLQLSVMYHCQLFTLSSKSVFSEQSMLACDSIPLAGFCDNFLREMSRIAYRGLVVALIFF